jgi:translation initiation factor IF-2
MRLNQIARKLDTSTETIVKCLENRGIVIKSAPNTKITPEQILLLAEDLPGANRLIKSAPSREKKPEKAPEDKKETIEVPEEAGEAEKAPQSEEPKAVQEAPVERKGEATEVAPKKYTIPIQKEEVSDNVTTEVPQKEVNKSLEEATTQTLTKPPIKKIKVYAQEKKGVTSQYPKPRKRIPRSDLKKENSSGKPTTSRGAKRIVGHKNVINRRSEYRRQKRNKQPLYGEGITDIISVTELISTQDLALLFDTSTQEMIDACLELGIEVSSNQRLDSNVISLAAEAFEKKVEIVSFAKQEESSEEAEIGLVPRIPIVVVMGHVDHGKTSLLDYIRNSKVVKGEDGGITQHIGGYKVTMADKREVTFLDTPGHKAFTAMRARGARVTDIAIIIIAADDGIMPQTKEAISHAQLAGIPMVFAFNKIDLPNVDTDRIKQQLAEMKIMVEDWGGKYQTQGISAKTGEGVNELLEKVLLEAEMLELKANPDKIAKGSVIEASIETGKGYIATLIVQEGTLKRGDVVLAGPCFGKVKAMTTTLGERLKEAIPATPVQILGLNGAPQAGEAFQVVASEKEARAQASQYQNAVQEQKHRTYYKPLQRFEEELSEENKERLQINIIVKGDADGSVEALADILPTLSNEDASVKIIHKAVGPIAESDISLAVTTNAIIIGFHTKVETQAKQMLRDLTLEVKMCRVIYEAIDFVEELIENAKDPIKEQVFVGRAEVVRIFTISHVGTIAGCIVRQGSIKRNGSIRILRNDKELYAGPIKQLKREKDTIKEAKVDTECGITAPGFNDIKEGDIIECFETKIVKK